MNDELRARFLGSSGARPSTAGMEEAEDITSLDLSGVNKSSVASGVDVVSIPEHGYRFSPETVKALEGQEIPLWVNGVWPLILKVGPDGITLQAGSLGDTPLKFGSKTFAFPSAGQPANEVGVGRNPDPNTYIDNYKVFGGDLTVSRLHLEIRLTPEKEIVIYNRGRGGTAISLELLADIQGTLAAGTGEVRRNLELFQGFVEDTDASSTTVLPDEWVKKKVVLKESPIEVREETGEVVGYGASGSRWLLQQMSDGRLQVQSLGPTVPIPEVLQQSIELFNRAVIQRVVDENFRWMVENLFPISREKILLSLQIDGRIGKGVVNGKGQRTLIPHDGGDQWMIDVVVTPTTDDGKIVEFNRTDQGNYIPEAFKESVKKYNGFRDSFPKNLPAVTLRQVAQEVKAAIGEVEGWDIFESKIPSLPGNFPKEVVLWWLRGAPRGSAFPLARIHLSRAPAIIDRLDEAAKKHPYASLSEKELEELFPGWGNQNFARRTAVLLGYLPLQSWKPSAAGVEREAEVSAPVPALVAPPTAENARVKLNEFLGNPDIQNTIALLTNGKTIGDVTHFFDGLKELAQKAGYKEGIVEIVPLSGLPSVFLVLGEPVRIFVQDKWREVVQPNLAGEVAKGLVRFVETPKEAGIVIGDETVSINTRQVLLQVTDEEVAAKVTGRLLQYLQEKGLLAEGSIVFLNRLFTGDSGEALLIFA